MLDYLLMKYNLLCNLILYNNMDKFGKLKSRIEDLEAHNVGLEFEVRKLKEAIILLEAKMNKKPRNYFDYSDTESEEEHFYLDHINGV